MFSGHWVWRIVPVRVSIDYPPIGIDYSKLFFLKSPYHTQIACWFNLSVVCSAGLKDPNLLLFWTLVAGVAPVTLWILVKLRDVWCYCCWFVCVCCFCCCYCVCFCCCCCNVAALCVGCFAMTNVIFSALYVGFCIPLCKVL